jgi:hypothetical protein
MANRFNIKFVNAFLLLSFIALLVLSFTVDASRLAGLGELETARFWYLSNIHPQKVVCTVLSLCAATLFFFMASKYHVVHVRKTDKYLASLILYAAVYQAFSRSLDAYYMISESDFTGFVYVAVKFYLPLDLMSVILFAIMAFEVFLLPSMEKTSTRRMSSIMQVLGIVGSAIGVVFTLFYYLPADSPVKIVVAIAGIILYLIILLLVLRTAINIFQLWTRTKHVVELLYMGFQLLLLVGALVFFIVVEAGTVLTLSSETLYNFRIIKEAMFLAVAVLYHFGFIKPSREKLAQ